MSINLFTAVMLAVGGFTIGLRQIMLSPKNSTFPCAPVGVRIAMFLAAVTVGGIAVLFLGHAQDYAGSAAVPVSVLAAVMAFYNTIMAWNVVAQRLPPGVWLRLDRAQARVRAPAVPRGLDHRGLGPRVHRGF